jgi:hypothetical protein
MQMEFKAQLSPKFQRRLLKLWKTLERAPWFSHLIKGVDLTESQLRGNDTRPEWVKNLAKKVHDAFTLAKFSTGKSDIWRQGASCGAGIAALSEMRKHPDWYSNSLSPEQSEEFTTLIRELLQLENSARLKEERELADFFAGFAEGLNNSLEPNGLPVGVCYNRFKLDLLLLALGEHVEECQTTTELYNFILGDDKIPPPWLGDLDSFQRYCRELGIRLGPRGRPEIK